MTIAVVCLVILTPVFAARIPPLTDYPNHLARLWLLSDGTTAVPFYRVQFDTFTNIAIDLVALSLGKMFGFMIAGRAAVAAAVALPMLGGALLWRSIHGRMGWWTLSFGLLVWGQSLLSGFLNFQIAIGLALVFAALEPPLQKRAGLTQVAARTALGFTLLLAHPFGLMFYAMLIVAVALGPRMPRGLKDWRVAMGRILIGLSGIAIVLVIFFLAVSDPPGTQEHSGLQTLGAELLNGFRQFGDNPGRKLFNSLFAFSAYSKKLDAVLAVSLTIPVALAALSGRLKVHAGLLLLSLGLLFVYFACPDYLLGAYWVDVRFAVMLPFALVAAVNPALASGPGRMAATLLAAALVVRTATVAVIWHERQADVASVLDALTASPNGIALLTVEQRPADRSAAPPGRFTTIGENSFRHLGALAVPWQKDFVPTLFSARGKQPIIVLPPWDEVAEPNGSQLADIHALDDSGEDRGLRLAPYVAFWRSRFDYVLVLNADMPDRFGLFVPPEGLALVRNAGFAQLFRVTAKPGQ